MATMTIRNIDEGLKHRLRVRAAQNGRSMEEEARTILRLELEVTAELGANLFDRIRQRLGPDGGADIDLPAREPAADPRFPPR